MIDQAGLPDSSISPQSLKWRLTLGVILVNLFVVSLAISSLRQSWIQLQERAETTTKNLSKVLEEEFGSDFDKIDVALLTASEEVTRQISAGDFKGKALNDFLLRQQSRLPEIVSLNVTDERGVVTHGNNLAPGAANVSDQRYFARQRDDSNAGLVIDQPVPARINNQWSIPLSRRINLPDGSFAGVVYVNLSIDHLIRTFSTLDLGRNGIANLRDADLNIMARFPEQLGTGSTIGKPTASPPLKQLIEAGQTAGTYRVLAVLDNIERTYSYRKIGDYPLYVTVGFARDDYLVDWKLNAFKLTLWAILFLIATLMGSRLIYRALMRQQIAYNFLYNSEERFRYTLENSPIGMAIVSLDGKFIQVNQALCQIVGYEKQELKNLSFQDITHPNDLDADLDNIKRLLNCEIASFQIEKRYIRKDGQIVWVQLTGSIVRDAKGIPLHFLAQVENITERRRAAEQLSLSAKVFEDSRECIVITDNEERIVSVNKAFSEVTGYSAGEVFGKTPRIMSSGRQDTDFYEGMWKSLIDTGYWCGEIWDRRKNGEIYPNWLSISAVKDAQNQVSHYISIFSDITERKQAEEALRDSNEALHSILETTLDGFWRVDSQGKLLDVNPTYCQQSGYTREELLEMRISDLDAVERPTETGERIRRLIENGRDQFETRHRRKDRSIWEVEVSTTFRNVEDGQVFAFLRDITERKQAEADLRIAASAFDAQEGMVITDANSLILRVNRAFTEITGYTAEEVMGQTPRLLKSNRHAADFYRGMWESINRTGGWRGEIWDRRKNGEEYPKWLAISAVKDDEGAVTHYIGTHYDITERKKAEAQIEFLAYHDALTKLPNRLLAMDHLAIAIAYAERAGTKTAVLFLDLDNFKTINDSFGHATGDDLLVAVSKRLRECTRETDTISRQGGDEFLIVLADVPDTDSITLVTEKILEQLEETFNIGGNEISTSLSIGIAVYPDDSRDVDTLLKFADTAMFHAKEAGRNASRFYTEQMNVDAVEHQHIRVGLKRALERGEFALYYQPQINLSSGALIGAEALIRWNHPERGLLLPGSFLSIAEESGLIVPMGDWVLHEACRQASAWRRAGLPEFVVAVNVSAMQFQRGDLEQSLLRALAESGLPPSLLELELTESILIQDTEKVLETVQRLKSYGLMLSIDDFGTGYSSLSYLKRFNVDKLKIDRSFVCDMIHNPNDANIVRAIIQMASNLNLKTIAEGIEDELLLSFLRLQYCDEGQGYHFSRPLPADEFASYAARNAHEQSGTS